MSRARPGSSEKDRPEALVTSISPEPRSLPSTSSARRTVATWLMSPTRSSSSSRVKVRPNRCAMTAVTIARLDGRPLAAV